MKSKQAFSLTELLITLFLLSILLALSLPSLSGELEKVRTELSMGKLASAIALAKSIAIANKQLVTLCRSSDGLKCGGKWQDGLLIFLDANGDRKINHQDSVQRYISFAFIQGDLKWRAFQNRQYLQFTSQGFTRYQNGNFTYCPEDKNPKFASQIIINRTGRVRFAPDSDDDGIKEDSQGRAISCS